MFVDRLKLSGLFVLIASLHVNDVHAGTLEDEHRCLALALYWEARGESRRGTVSQSATRPDRSSAVLSQHQNRRSLDTKAHSNRSDR